MIDPRKLVLLACFSLSAVACGGASTGPPTGSVCPKDSTITYANFGQAFIQDNCLGCHTTRGPVLTTQAGVQAARSQIDEVAASGPNATNTMMPQDHGVPTDQRVKLGEWLACGAP